MKGGRGEEGEEVLRVALTFWDTFTLRVIPGLKGMLPPLLPLAPPAGESAEEGERGPPC